MGIEKFNIEDLIVWAECYPEFKEKFIETFDNKESLEVFLKLTINVNAYFESGYDYDGEYFECYDYENMIKDLAIQYEIYENEMDFYKDCHKAEFYKDYNDKYFGN